MFELSALQLSQAIREGKFSVREVVSAYLDRAEKNEHNAFISIAREQALARADEVQAKVDAGKNLSELAGVPIGIKDNISTVNITTTCASEMLKNYIPIFNATVIEKVENAGMVVIGKLNLDEFAMGSSCETSAFGVVKNPHDTSRVAGGSSGGCAAAIAAGEVLLALGTDTGGSIRQPCSFCGVTGIKPTYGAVSRYGGVAVASSLDQIGPMGRDIDDCAALLSIISGPDSRDSTCVIDEPFVFSTPSNNLNGIKIGLPTNYLTDGIDQSVADAVHSAAQGFKIAGATVEEFDIPFLDYAIDTYYTIACAETSSNMSRFDGLKYGSHANADNLSELYRKSRSQNFGKEIKQRIMLGSFVLSSGNYDKYYKRALQAREIIKEAYEKLFKQFDLILSPVSPTVAYKIGGNINDPMAMYMDDKYSCSANLAGLPAVALPCEVDNDGLPIGIQLIGQAFSEPKLVNAAQVYKSLTEVQS